jgi:hypothetical protein
VEENRTDYDKDPKNPTGTRRARVVFSVCYCCVNLLLHNYRTKGLIASFSRRRSTNTPTKGCVFACAHQDVCPNFVTFSRSVNPVIMLTAAKSKKKFLQQQKMHRTNIDAAPLKTGSKYPQLNHFKPVALAASVVAKTSCDVVEFNRLLKTFRQLQHRSDLLYSPVPPSLDAVIKLSWFLLPALPIRREWIILSSLNIALNPSLRILHHVFTAARALV